MTSGQEIVQVYSFVPLKLRPYGIYISSIIIVIIIITDTLTPLVG